MKLGHDWMIVEKDNSATAIRLEMTIESHD